MIRVCVCSSGEVFTSIGLTLVAGMKNQNPLILTLSVLVSTELLVTLTCLMYFFLNFLEICSSNQGN